MQTKKSRVYIIECRHFKQTVIYLLVNIMQIKKRLWMMSEQKLWSGAFVEEHAGVL